MKITYYAQSDILSIELTDAVVVRKHSMPDDPLTIMGMDVNGAPCRLDVVGARGRGIQMSRLQFEQIDDENVTRFASEDEMKIARQHRLAAIAAARQSKAEQPT